MPLRPNLYHRLQQRFGDVAISHEGEEMDAYVTKDPCNLDRHGQPRMKLQIEARGEQYILNCPFCNDTRKRLSINYMFGFWDAENRIDHIALAHCFNAGCPLPGNMTLKRKLYHMIFDDVSVDEIALPLPPDTVLEGHKAPKQVVEAGAPGKLLALSNLDPAHPACRYVRERGYDPKDLYARYKVCYCPEAYPQFPAITGRIVIPIYMRGKLAGWQARYVGKPPEKWIPKYWSMPHMQKGSLLYNFDVAWNYPYVVVTEGVTDAWRYGPEAVALLGNKPTHTQSQLLLSVWQGGAIFCMLDGAARDENLALYDMLKNGVTPVVRVDLPGDKDPDSCTTEYLRTAVAQAAAAAGVNLATLTRPST